MKVLVTGAAMAVEDAVVLAEELGKDVEAGAAPCAFTARRFECAAGSPRRPFTRPAAVPSRC